MRYIAALLLFVSFSSFADPGTVFSQLLNTVKTKSKPTITKSGCSSAFYGIEWILYSNGEVEKIRNSPNCTIQLPPVAGTLVNSGCSTGYPGVEWFVYNDGEGGTYVEKDAQSTACGWSPPTLTLSLTEEFGDAFKPVVVNVDYINFNGKPEPWGMEHSSSSIGNAIRVDQNTIEIYGDGQLGNGIFTLGNQEIQFFIEEEPICLVESSVDCVGYRQRSGQSLIYYGEDDEQVVVWELAILLYASHYKFGDDITVGLYDKYDQQSDVWKKWQQRVDKYNEVYEQSGVHIRFKLKRLQDAHWHDPGNIGSMLANKDVDIALGHGWTFLGTCGVARVKTYFREGYPPGSISSCGIYTDLHEIGHSVGLAHGPENQSNSAYGYIFPEFGHGYNDICGQYDDLMSYGSQGVFHSNSLKFCGDIMERSIAAMPAGDRLWSDTAYALNRVRFNVSLIHNEHNTSQHAQQGNRSLRQLLNDDIIVVD